MRIPAALCFLLASLVSFSQSVPPSKKNPALFKIHNQSLTDNYAWLEQYDSEETQDWVAAQNKATTAVLEDIHTAKAIAMKIREYDRLSTSTLPDKKGRYFYKLYRKDDKNTPFLAYRKSLNDDPTEIVTPSKLYNDPNVFISDYHPSQNSKYLATEFNTDGSDRHEVRFYNLTTGTNLPDILKSIKYSDVEWNGDLGVFYKKNNNATAFAKDSTYQLYYHKMGESQEKDFLIFDTSKTENSFVFFTTKERLFIVESNKDETLKTYHTALLNTFPLQLEKFIENEPSDFRLISYRNNRIYFSSAQYDWGEIRSMDIRNRKDEKVIVPQIYTHLLENSYFLDDYILCKYRTLDKKYLIVYDNDGTFIKKVDLPKGVDFKFKFYDPEKKDIYVYFYSRTLPYQNYKINLVTGEANHFYNDYIKPKPTIFPLDYFETKSVYYKSRDGKDVPITIIHKKGMALDGNNPTLLEAYGGFGKVSPPAFETSILYFLENGGVYAFAEIRGGGEKGVNWHKEGKGIKKINSFNDFIDAAEYLIREKYTSPSKLGISGVSNGGLVVGVAMTQRPDLFKVAIPVAGVYDMARYNLFATGAHHLDEYGNPEVKSEFDLLMRYSPYHNIKEDVNYPATLLLASENDDRVTPFQTYKFAAALQNRNAQTNPVCLKVHRKSGHSGRAQTYDGRVEAQAEFLSFLMHHLQ